MKRYMSALLAAAVAAFVSAATMIVMLPGGGLASQNNQFLPTTGVFSGLTAANTINNAIDSLNTCNSGSAAPTNALGGSPKLGQCWIDTTSATLPIKKRYTGSAWVVEAVIDVSNGRWSPPIGGGTATLASASTADLCASPQAVQTISGTTTITSFGSNCVVGVRKTLVFSGILTLTHNATSLIIPGGLSKTTANGDVAEAVYLGSGNWRVVSYVPIAGTVVTSIAGNTGAFTLSSGITNSTNDIRIDTAYGGRKLLNTLTASNSATLSDTTSLTSSFNDYDIVFEDIIPATTAQTCEIQLQVSASFQTTGYLGTAVATNTGAAINNTTTYIPCSGTIHVTNSVGISGTMRLHGPVSSTSNNKKLSGTVTYFNTPNAEVAIVGGWYNGSQAAVTGFQVLFASGNITSGTIKIYGVR